MQKKNEISRRTFIASATKGAVLLSAAGMVNSCSLFSDEKAVIPRRKLGKTGLEVSILAFGGGSQFLRNKNGEWEKHLETAVKSGINLFDTAPNYTVASPAGGKMLSSEERYGAILPPYRSKIHLITKLDLVDGKRDPDGARKSVEESLKRLKTDYIDILLIHAVNDKDSVSELENGVYKKMREMKEEGIIKFIGFSSMDSAERSRDLLENLEFDVAMLAVNATRYRNYVSVALPVAQEKGVGVIAIKTVRDLVGKDATAKELLEYVWTTDHIATALVGHYGLDVLKANIALAEEFGKNNQVSLDVAELEARMAAYAGPHALCWARPGYDDAGIVV
jgi:predicted aldo/keto reductase-like oxidoreductase